MDKSYEALLSENMNLKNENDRLRLLQDIARENLELRNRLFTTLHTNEENSGKKVTFQSQETIDEGKFTEELSHVPHKTSSPLTLDALTKGSYQQEDPSSINETAVRSDSITENKEDIAAHSRLPFDVKDFTSKNLERLLGEIVFQLDRRMLSYVFPGQSRLYGFTVLNMDNKIIELSTNPLTGKVDEDYRSKLTRRHHELMENLQCLGYCVSVHPALTEHIINTYGILKHRPDERSVQELGYNDPDFLRKVIINIAPRHKLKDLLVLLRCLCFLARQDGKPLFVW